MSEPALAAAYRAIRARLIDQSDTWAAPDWDSRAYADYSPPGAAMPHVVYYWSGGGEANRVQQPDAELVLVVKVVARTIASALRADGQISARLNDAGSQCAGDNTPLPESGDWHILTVTRETRVHMLEQYEGTEPLYHVGAQYRIKMELK